MMSDADYWQDSTFKRVGRLDGNAIFDSRFARAAAAAIEIMTSRRASATQCRYHYRDCKYVDWPQACRNFTAAAAFASTTSAAF